MAQDNDNPAGNRWHRDQPVVRTEARHVQKKAYTPQAGSVNAAGHISESGRVDDIGSRCSRAVLQHAEPGRYPGPVSHAHPGRKVWCRNAYVIPNQSLYIRTSKVQPQQSTAGCIITDFFSVCARSLVVAPFKCGPIVTRSFFTGSQLHSRPEAFSNL